MKKSIWGVCALLLTACVAQRHSAVTSEAGEGKETIDSLAPNPFIRHIYTADPSAHVWAACMCMPPMTSHRLAVAT
jgi:arabinoxylan arabinofuranohydrolase